MDPDDLISGTTMSFESDGMIELQDLSLVTACLTTLEREVLKVEYTLPTIPIDGVRDGDNKCDAVFRLCGERLHGRKFLKIAAEASRKVREELEQREWIPISKTFNRGSMDSLRRYHRKSSRVSKRSHAMRGRAARSS